MAIEASQSGDSITLTLSQDQAQRLSGLAGALYGGYGSPLGVSPDSQYAAVNAGDGATAMRQMFDAIVSALSNPTLVAPSTPAATPTSSPTGAPAA